MNRILTSKNMIKEINNVNQIVSASIKDFEEIWEYEYRPMKLYLFGLVYDEEGFYHISGRMFPCVSVDEMSKSYALKKEADTLVAYAYPKIVVKFSNGDVKTEKFQTLEEAKAKFNYLTTLVTNTI